MIEVKVVDPLANFDEAAAMLQANWDESGSPIPFVVEDARNFYTYLGQNNALFAVGAWDEGKLIGYCITTIVPHPLNHSVKICNADGMYVLPEYRGGMVLGRIIRAVQRLAQLEGANHLHWHAPAGSEFGEALAKRMIPISNYFREDVPRE